MGFVVLSQTYYYFSSSVSFFQIQDRVRDFTQSVTLVDDRCYLCPKYLQVISAAQEPQSVQKVERHQNPHQGIYEPPECRKQGKAAIYWLENHVKR